MNKTTIFTDGGAKDNPGPGGFAAIVIEGQEVIEVGGAEKNTTNNRMELRAAIEAIKVALGNDLVIYTDSSYLVNGITRWLLGWKENGWISKTKKEILNQDLWRELDSVIKDKKINWQVIGGHVAIAGNERADAIVSAFRDGGVPKLFKGALKNYSIKNILDISPDKLKEATKAKKNAHSRARAYSYVSMIDDEIQTHKTWAECEKRVKGKNALFRKAVSQENEEIIIEEFKKKRSNPN